ncbi:MAG: hypothetical protein J0M11_05280 [Anaerolineae bacterium]|nr:hypothetical protein [Anaerolineae bacterium]
MQLTLNLTFAPAPPRNLIRPTTWLDAGWATACIGFTKKVEISQSLSDALDHGDEDDHDQQHYDALWLAHHHLVIDQRPSLSFTFDFLRDDKLRGRYVEHSLRLHVEEGDQLILLGLLQDFRPGFELPWGRETHFPNLSTRTKE